MVEMTRVYGTLSGAQNAGVDYSFKCVTRRNESLNQKASPSKSKETSRRENWRERGYLQSVQASVVFYTHRRIAIS